MFGDMAWADGQGDAGGAPSDWELEMMRMRHGEGDAAGGSARQAPIEPMELSPDPFYLSNTPTTTSAAIMNTTGVYSSTTATASTFGALLAPPTLTSSASCPSFTSLYDFDSDDLLRDIPDGEPLMGDIGFPAGPMGIGGPPMDIGAGYDFVLQFQQQHQQGTMRQFPHQSALLNNDHMALLQQSRRPIHTSASFTSLSSMETEYRRRLAAKRKKAVAERWNKAQRHKSFDSTTSSVATAPSPSTSMEFSTYTTTTTSTFESTPETQYLEDLPAPRRSMESEMIGFSIDDFPTTLTSDASWPMPPPMSLNTFNTFGQVPQASDAASVPSEMDQLLLSDQEKANVSSLLDAIRDFDSPLPTHAEEKTTEPTARRVSPKLSGRPRSASGQNQQRAGRSPHLRGIARTDSGKRKESMSSPTVAPSPLHVQLQADQATLDSVTLSIRERIQQVLERPTVSVDLSEEEQAYIAQAPQFSSEKAAETAGSLWLLIHASKCVETVCSIGGCNVMRRVIRHCRGCDAPLGKCRDPCNDAKAMLLHHATCNAGKQTPEKDDDETSCMLCMKMQEIDKAHNALKSRPPLSPQAKPHPSPQFMPMVMPPLGMSALNALGGPVLIAPQPAFMSPMLKPAGSGSKHIPIQPNPLPTASNPMGMIGAFPCFGVSLALYLEQTSAAFRAEVKSRVEKRVTNAAGQDLIQHMQRKTRLRSLEDLRADARANVLGEMERELQLHMQAVNWASVANPSGGELPIPSAASSPGDTSESGLPSYLLSVAAAGFAAFYAQQTSLQAAIAGVGSPFGVPTPSRKPLSRQSSAGSLTTSASSSSLSSVPLAPKRSASSSSLTHQSPSMSPKEPLSSGDKKKDTFLSV